MGVQRRLNVLGQQRIDVPHLRSIESAVAADFDLLAGSIMAGKQALVVRGFEIDVSAALSNPATSLQLVTAGGILLHSLASEAGTIFVMDDDADPETLSVTNEKIVGSFTANAMNYIGIDLRLEADDSTSDIAMFHDATTKLETPKTIPLARTMDFRIVISTTDFSATPHVCPIAKVQTNASNVVTSVEDARQLLFRLGTGGTNPDALATFPFTGGRTEASTITAVGSSEPDIFVNGDKSITSQKAFNDAIMTRLWELGGGENWFSATSDREMRLVFGQPALASGDNFDWNSGTSTLTWQSVSVVFANSTGWNNALADNLVGVVLADGECLYVDVDRTQNATGLVAAKAAMTTLGSPTIPGSRVVIAWRKGSQVFVRDKAFEVGRVIPVATNTVQGTVKLSYAAGTPSDPVVVPLNATAGISLNATGNGTAVTGTGAGTGAGLVGSGGGTAGAGVQGTGGTGGDGGVFTGNGAGSGVTGTGGATNGNGVVGNGNGTGYGGLFTSGPTNGAVGIRAVAHASVTNADAGQFVGKGSGIGVVTEHATTGYALWAKNKVKIDGDVELLSSKNYKYDSTKTGYLYLWATDFVPDAGGGGAIQLLAADTAAGFQAFLEGDALFGARVKGLPPGAVITGIHVHGKNTAAGTTDVIVSAVLNTYANPAFTKGFVTGTAPTGNAVTIAMDTDEDWYTVTVNTSIDTIPADGDAVLYITVDPNNAAYLIDAVRITYEYDTVLMQS